MNEDALQTAVELCLKFEGVYLSPYLCPAGVPTIGVGSTRYLDGRAVRLTDPAISRGAALHLLTESLRRTYLPPVLKLCPVVDTADRLAALVDFAYNCGVGNLKASTLRRKVNAGDWEAVPSELAKWVRGGGRILPGLVKRRAAEAALI